GSSVRGVSMKPPPIPPALSQLRSMRARQMSALRQPTMRLPRGSVALQSQMVVAIMALGCATLAAIPFVNHYDLASNAARIATIIALAATVCGAVMTPLRFLAGPPLVCGGVALFVANAITLAISRIDISSALDTAESKIVLIAGVAGLVAYVTAVPLLVGRGLGSLTAVISLAAVAVVVATAFLVRIDDDQTWPQAGAIIAAVFVAAVIITGASKGRFGSVATLVAAVVQLPGWIDLADDGAGDRRWLVFVALGATALIVVLAALTLVLALTGTADRAFGIGPRRAVVSPVVQPMVSPVSPVMVPAAHARHGGVLTPVSITLAAHDPAAGSSAMPVGAVAHTSSTSASSGGVVVVTAAPVVAVPAVWSADPYGRHQLRYWDGAVWTEHVSDGGVVTVDVMA
ncbi:MAG TPA: DUF2510 domain-containing protein, partial [Ilumatobacteraceae bacterium]|nr:DUF2510 domain-containing protein [Ilumatobacteraceae bacterium]